MDEVFRALADPTRRLLLDRLFVRDGQTVGELASGLEMTRFGAMKHLRILEAAGLIATKRVGREKLHYLNPVPIQLLADRWVSKYAARWASALGALKRDLEAEMIATRPTHVYEIYIRTTPERLWRAITDGNDTSRYYYGTAVNSTWEVGAPLTYTYPDGTLAAEGTVLEIDRPNRLVTTFHAVWDPEVAADRAHRMTWEIVLMGDACRLSVTSDDFDGETATYRSVAGGMSVILSGLKTLVETDEALAIGG
ncbi:MAG: helix-turn-helix domain-containing protein [Chloroflexota bacterium]|nr:helix-turn-helix domain-containing protein [Chloroflexota bacterium]